MPTTSSGFFRSALLSVVPALVLCCSDAPAESPPVPTEVVRDQIADRDALIAAADPAAVEEKRRELFGDIRDFVFQLQENGRYGCCVKMPCNMCAVLAGGCKCADGLAKGEPVCEECALAWRNGQGSVPGVDPKSVRSFLEARDGCPCGD